MTDLKKALREWREKNPLRAWRKTYGYTREDAATMIGCSVTSIQTWEFNGGTPNEEHIIAMAKRMGVMPIILVGDWQRWEKEKPT